jgi:sporulation protein YlmC with PRC-barrel domain
MKFKQTLMATAAAVLLTAGGAVAQDAPSSRPDPAPLTPSANQPGSASGGLSAGGNASGGVSPGGSTSSDMSGSMKSSASLSSASLTEIKDDSAIISALDVNVKKLKGMDIVGSDGKKIGEIDKVLADSSNQPKAVTVDAGGFLGIGGHEVILPLDQLQKSTDKDFKISMTKEQVEKLEKYEAKRDAGPAKRDVATGAGGQPATSVPPR